MFQSLAISSPSATKPGQPSDLCSLKICLAKLDSSRFFIWCSSASFDFWILTCIKMVAVSQHSTGLGQDWLTANSICRKVYCSLLSLSILSVDIWVHVEQLFINEGTIASSQISRPHLSPPIELLSQLKKKVYSV